MTQKEVFVFAGVSGGRRSFPLTTANNEEQKGQIHFTHHSAMKSAALLSVYVVLFGLCEAIQLNFEYFDDSEPDASDESISNSSLSGGRISLFNILERSLKKNNKLKGDESSTTTTSTTTTEEPIEISPIIKETKVESESSEEVKEIKNLESPQISEIPKKFSRKEKKKFRLMKNREKGKELKSIEIEPVMNEEEEKERREETTTTQKPARKLHKYNREKNRQVEEYEESNKQRQEDTKRKRNEDFKVVLPPPPRFPPIMLATRLEQERETLPIFLDEVDLDDFNDFRQADLQFGNKNGAESPQRNSGELPPLKVFGFSPLRHHSGHEREFLSSRAPPSPPIQFEMKAKVRYAKRGAADYSNANENSDPSEKIQNSPSEESLNDSGAARILIKTTQRSTTTRRTTTQAPVVQQRVQQQDFEEQEKPQQRTVHREQQQQEQEIEPEQRSRDLETPKIQIPDDWRFSHLAPLPAPVLTQVAQRPRNPPQDQQDQFERNIEDLIRVEADHYRDDDPYGRAFSEFPRLENNENPVISVLDADQRDAFFGNEDEFEELLEPAPSSYGRSSYPDFDSFNF